MSWSLCFSPDIVLQYRAFNTSNGAPWLTTYRFDQFRHRIIHVVLNALEKSAL